MMTYCFDMDGTIADLYGVNGWLEMLIASDETPYAIAKPLVNLSRLARAINKTRKNGNRVEIISWLSKSGTPEYNAKVTRAKMEWLKKHLPSVEFDAIHIVDGVAKVDEEKCTACGCCVKACPKNVIELVPKNKKVTVLCKNKQIGKETMKICASGCIGCKICENKCPFSAITVTDNLARIDYDKCESCGLCAKLCPKKVIIGE